MNIEMEDAKRLITHIFFLTVENQEKLGNNSEQVLSITEGISEKDVTLRILHLIWDLYFGNSVTESFLKTLERNRKPIFRYLDDPMIHKTCNFAKHHFFH